MPLRAAPGAPRRRAAAPATAAAGPVDLNTATAEQLDELDGIGPGMARSDPRVPRGARRLRLGRGARPGPGHRREAAGGAAGEGARVTGAPAARRAARWLECVAAREHPRHIVLFALAAGLALGPISAPATVAAAARGRGRGRAAARSRRWRPAPCCSARSSPTRGSPHWTPASLARVDGPALGGRGDAARAGARARAPRRRPRPAQRLDEAAVRGCACPSAPGRRGAAAPRRSRAPRVARAGAAGRRRAPAMRGRPSAPSWPSPAASRRSGATTPISARRGAHAALEVDRWRATGASRGGLAGALDARAAARRGGLGRGLRAARGGAARRDGARPGRAAVRGGRGRTSSARASRTCWR